MGARNHGPVMTDIGIEKRNNGRAASKYEKMEGMLPKAWNNGSLFHDDFVIYIETMDGKSKMKVIRRSKRPG